MAEVVSVRFREDGKAYFFNPSGIEIKEGDALIVETAQGAEYGTCVQGLHEEEDHIIVPPLRSVLRKATESDLRTVERNRRREKDAFGICEKKIAEHGLEMKLVGVECAFEGNKIIFFFTADGRVDFRALVRDLASVFHARIELRQIGVRDEAKMLGGLGVCGQPFCCSRFLSEFQPVSIKMAKTQSLSLNPTKISGVCGRLMCCLKYEQDAYEDAAKRLPTVESYVQTPDGPGNVSAVDLVRETVRVRLDTSPETPKPYRMEELVVLRRGKGSREGIDLPPRPKRSVQDVEKSGCTNCLRPCTVALGQEKSADTAEKRGGRGEKRRNHNEHKVKQKDQGEHPRRTGNQQRTAGRPVRFGANIPIAPSGSGSKGAKPRKKNNYHPPRRKKD